MNEELKQAIIAFQNGDVDSFTDIYKLQYDHVYYIALQHARHEQEAQDITQEVFIEIYKSLSQLKEVTHFNAWLNKITYSYFIKSIRSKQIKKRVHLNEDSNLENIIVDPTVTPSDQYISEEILGAVEASFDLLSKDQKEVARMRFYDELSISEISDVMKVPEGTIKSRIHTVRKLLQDDLKSEFLQLRITVAPLVYLYFRSLLENQKYVSEINIGENLKRITSAITIVPFWTKVKNAGASQAGNIAIGACIVAAPLTVHTITQDKVVKIQEVSYEKSWTNQDLPLTFTFNEKNLNVDSLEVKHNGTDIDINEQKQVTIGENGPLSIYYNGTLLHHETITNIDKQGPQLEMKQVENQLEIIISDALSGVDWDSVSLVDEQGKPVSYKKQDQSIVFEKDTLDTYTIQAADLLGNYYSTKIISSDTRSHQ